MVEISFAILVLVVIGLFVAGMITTVALLANAVGMEK
jgi:hypothetical protein